MVGLEYSPVEKTKSAINVYIFSYSYEKKRLLNHGFKSCTCLFSRILLLSFAEEPLPQNPFVANHAIEERVETVVDTSKVHSKIPNYFCLLMTFSVNPPPENQKDSWNPANNKTKRQYGCDLDSLDFGLEKHPVTSLLT